MKKTIIFIASLIMAACGHGNSSSNAVLQVPQDPCQIDCELEPNDSIDEANEKDLLLPGNCFVIDGNLDELDEDWFYCPMTIDFIARIAMFTNAGLELLIEFWHEENGVLVMSNAISSLGVTNIQEVVRTGNSGFWLRITGVLHPGAAINPEYIVQFCNNRNITKIDFDEVEPNENLAEANSITPFELGTEVRVNGVLDSDWLFFDCVGNQTIDLILTTDMLSTIKLEIWTYRRDLGDFFPLGEALGQGMIQINELPLAVGPKGFYIHVSSLQATDYFLTVLSK